MKYLTLKTKSGVNVKFQEYELVVDAMRLQNMQVKQCNLARGQFEIFGFNVTNAQVARARSGEGLPKEFAEHWDVFTKEDDK